MSGIAGAPQASAGDAPAWMHALVSVPLPALMNCPCPESTIAPEKVELVLLAKIMKLPSRFNVPPVPESVPKLNVLNKAVKVPPLMVRSLLPDAFETINVPPFTVMGPV